MSLITVQSYNIVCQSKTQSPDDEIREEHLKHIEEITKDLAPPKFANLTEDQQDFLDRKGRYAPYWHLRTAEVETEDEEYW